MKKLYRSVNTFFKAVVVAALATLFFPHYQASAQELPADTAAVAEPEINTIFKYRGIEAALGSRHFLLQSDIPELKDLMVNEEGGSAAFIFGNNYSRIVARVAGLYYSNSTTNRTIDLFEMELNSNLYILKALQLPAKKIDAYVLTGIGNQHIKFYGHYIDKNERANKSSAAGREPYLGKITTTNINVGIGIEYKMEADRDFIHFFAEGKTRFHLNSSADADAFANTSTEDFYAVNVGVRFGRRN